MTIAVTDANIFIDLIKLNLLSLLFETGFENYVCREVIDQLNDEQYAVLEDYVVDNTLKVYDFTPTELTEVEMIEAPRALEFADKTVLYLAIKIKAEVLTGDGPLRKFCERKGLTVRGILWLLDTFVEMNHLQKEEAHKALNDLMAFNSRLPLNDCNDRLKKWKVE